tara:strand:+ start:1382 stop:5719 length:4338 start_codon:yes stop_codon:yes gene_type:complete
MPTKKNINYLKQKEKLMEFITLDTYKNRKPSGNNFITYKFVEKTGTFLINSTHTYSPGIKKYYKNSVDCVIDLLQTKMNIRIDDTYVFVNEWKGKGKWVGVRKLETVCENMVIDTELYEQLCADRPRRLYIDIDLEAPTEDKKFKNEFKNRITGCKKALRKLLPTANIAISLSTAYSSKGKFKYSAHIHTTNAYMTYTSFEKFGQYLLNEGLDLDYSVYKGVNQLFKFPFQLKEADRRGCLEDRKQIPLNPKRNTLDFVIQYIPKDAVCIDLLLKDINIVKYKKKNKEGKYEYKKMAIQVSKNRLYVRNLNRITPYEIINCFDDTPECMCGEAYWRIMVYMVRMRMSFQQFIDKFNEPYKLLPDNDKYINSWKKTWDTISRDKVVIRTEAIVNILKAQYPTFVETDINSFIDDIINETNYKGDMTLVSKLDNYITSEIYDRERIAIMKYMVVAGSLGSGKTQSTLEYMCRILDNQEKIGKIIFVCNRITLKEDVKGNITRLGKKYANRMYDYKLLDRGDLHLPKKNFILLTTLESLHKFDVKEYDLVVIDECESVVKTFLTYGTIKEHQYEATAKKFFDLLTTAKKVFLLDGLLMGRTYRLIENLEGSPNYHTIITENKNKQNRSIIYYKNTGLTTAHYKFVQDLLHHTQEGRKAIVFMPHKTGRGSSLQVNKEGQGVYLLKQLFLNHCKDLKEKDVAIHCGSHKNNKELFDVRAFWEDKRLILSTAAITNGVSYDIENDIDSIWIMNDSSFTDNRDLAQFQGRARHPIDRKIRYCDLNQGRVPMPFAIPTYARGDFVAPNFTIKPAKVWITNKEGVKELVDGYASKQIDEKEMRYKKAITDLHKDLSLEYYCKGSEVLFKMFDKIDIKISETIATNDEMEKSAKAELEKAIQNPYKFEPHWIWENIDDIGKHTAEEYWFKAKGGQLDDENRYKLEKYQLVHEFHKNTDPKVLEELWNMKNVVEAFNSLLFNGRHFIQYCFDFKVSRRHFLAHIPMLKKKIKQQNKLDLKELEALVWKKNRLRTIEHKGLNGRFDSGNFYSYSGSALIDKAVAYLFTPKYYEEGQFLQKAFYKHLLLFIECYNPKAEIRLPFLRYKAYTVWFRWEDESKQPINVSEVYRSDERTELQKNLIFHTFALSPKEEKYVKIFRNGSFNIHSWKYGTTRIISFLNWIGRGFAAVTNNIEYMGETPRPSEIKKKFNKKKDIEWSRHSYTQTLVDHYFGNTDKYKKYLEKIQIREDRTRDRILRRNELLIIDSDEEGNEEKCCFCRDCHTWFIPEDTLWKPQWKVMKLPRGTGTYDELVKENGKWIRKEFKTKLLGYRYGNSGTCAVCKVCYSKTLRKKWGFILLIAKLKAKGARVKEERKQKKKMTPTKYYNMYPTKYLEKMIKQIDRRLNNGKNLTDELKESIQITRKYIKDAIKLNKLEHPTFPDGTRIPRHSKASLRT